MKYIEYVELITALYLFFLGACVEGVNVRSNIVFRFIPIMLGIFLFFQSLKTFGIL